MSSTRTKARRLVPGSLSTATQARTGAGYSLRGRSNRSSRESSTDGSTSGVGAVVSQTPNPIRPNAPIQTTMDTPLKSPRMNATRHATRAVAATMNAVMTPPPDRSTRAEPATAQYPEQSPAPEADQAQAHPCAGDGVTLASPPNTVHPPQPDVPSTSPTTPGKSRTSHEAA
mgnify:CR=1 FL=1